MLRLSEPTRISGRSAALCSKTSSRALAVGVNSETLIRPVPSFRWESTRAKAGNFSTSVKRSRTNGRTIAFLFEQPESALECDEGEKWKRPAHHRPPPLGTAEK